MTSRLSRRECLATLGRIATMVGLPLGPIATSGCRRDEEVQTTVDEVAALADAITEAVHGARSPKAGVTEARRRLAQARERLTERVLSLKRMRTGAMSPQLQRAWRDAFIDALAQVEALRTELRPAIAADPELARELDALVTEFADLLRRKPLP